MLSHRNAGLIGISSQSVGCRSIIGLFTAYCFTDAVYNGNQHIDVKPNMSDILCLLIFGNGRQIFRSTSLSHMLIGPCQKSLLGLHQFKSV